MYLIVKGADRNSTVMEGTRFGVRQAWTQTPSLPLTCCVILGNLQVKSLDFPCIVWRWAYKFVKGIIEINVHKAFIKEISMLSALILKGKVKSGRCIDCMMESNFQKINDGPVWEPLSVLPLSGLWKLILPTVPTSVQDGSANFTKASDGLSWKRGKSLPSGSLFLASAQNGIREEMCKDHWKGAEGCPGQWGNWIEHIGINLCKEACL